MDTEKKEKKELLGSVENLIDEDRVLNFSDGVFAFAATLLVLKIDLPQLDYGQLTTSLGAQLFMLWPQYFANIISFLIIGYYWLNHHAIFNLIKKFDTGIVWINIVFLIFLSFVPFPVDIYGDHPTIPAVIIFYSASLAIVGIFLSILWTYALKKGLVIEHLTYRRKMYYSLRFFLAPFVFLVSIPLVLIDPLLSQLSWILVIVGIVVINRRFNYKHISEIEKVSI